MVFEKAIRVLDSKAKHLDELDGIQSIQLGEMTMKPHLIKSSSISSTTSFRADTPQSEALFSNVSLVPVIPSPRHVLGHARVPSVADLSPPKDVQAKLGPGSSSGSSSGSRPAIATSLDMKMVAPVSPRQTKNKSRHRSKLSTTSETHSSVYSEAHSVKSGTSTGTRQSARAKGRRKSIVESDEDENEDGPGNGKGTAAKRRRGRSRDVDEDAYEELEED
jgi:hypothetical protein